MQHNLAIAEHDALLSLAPLSSDKNIPQAIGAHEGFETR